jgi:hypothetical protein
MIYISSRMWFRLLWTLFMVFTVTRVHAQTSVTVPATTYVSGQTQTVNATISIQTQPNAAVIVSSGAKITFSAGSSVVLQPGFHALPGAQFQASVDSDGDGIPDAWELSHGLNPNDSTDAMHTDSNGRTYLLVYQLGLEPGHGSQSDPTNTGTALKVHKPQ